MDELMFSKIDDKIRFCNSKNKIRNISYTLIRRIYESNRRFKRLNYISKSE